MSRHIPDPPTSQSAPLAGGEGNPARDDTRVSSRAAGYVCVCGQPLEESLRDMWVFASPTTVAYLPCLFGAA